MRYLQTKMYSLSALLIMLPLMEMEISELPDYLRGTEFISFLAQVITQLITGVVDAFIAIFLGGLFAGGA